MQKRFFEVVRVLIEPCSQVHGQWNAWCPDFDLLTVGSTAAEALSMIAEASLMIIVDDLARGVDPRERKAPIEEWDRVFRAAGGELRPVAIEELARLPIDGGTCVLADMVLNVELVQQPQAKPKNESRIRTLHRPAQDHHCA